MLLQADVHDQHRDHHQHHRGRHQAVVHTRLGADLVKQAGDGPLLRIAQEEGLGEEIVIAPEEGEDGHRGEGGFCRGDDDAEIDLKHVAAVQIGALLQVDGDGLDEAHEDDDGKAEVARDLGQDHRQEAQPAVARAGETHHRLHAENGDDGGKDRKHHARHDEAVEEAPAAETIAHQAVGGQARQDHHADGDRPGDEKAVEIGVLEVRALPGRQVVVPGEGLAQGQGEGIGHDKALLPEGVEDDPDKGIDRGEGPEAQHQIGQGHADTFSSRLHALSSSQMSSEGRKIRLATLDSTTPSTTISTAMVEP